MTFTYRQLFTRKHLAEAAHKADAEVSAEAAEALARSLRADTAAVMDVHQPEVSQNHSPLAQLLVPQQNLLKNMTITQDLNQLQLQAVIQNQNLSM
jgi:hypothetical protein